MIAQSRSRSPHHHQCPTTGPHDSRSECDCNAMGKVSTLSLASTGANNSAPASPVSDFQTKPLSPTTSVASTSSVGTFSQQPPQSEADKRGILGAISNLSSSSSSHPNVYLDTDATPEAEGDNDISTLSSIYIGSDSESGLPLAPVSAEENIWSSSASNNGNGTGCLPAHPRGPLSPANGGRYHPSASATTLPSTFIATASPESHSITGYTMVPGSFEKPTASSSSPAAPTVTEYERDTYNYHKARTTTNVPTPSPTTPGASSAQTETPTPSNDQLLEAPSSSTLQDPQGCYTSYSCTDTGSRLAAHSSSRDDTGISRSGTGTPVALDTPAFRTPLGVYNGFVHDHDRRPNDKEGYFSPSSSISSVISAASVQLRDETKERLPKQKRPQLRHFPSLARGVEVEETSSRQTLSLLALPAELVAHILRMGYFSPPRPAKPSPNAKSTSASTSSASITPPSALDASHLYTDTTSRGVSELSNNRGNFLLSSNDELWSATDDDLLHQDELEDEDDTPPTITSDPHFRLALLHTCRALRAAVFADPALWSIIRLGPGDGEGGVRRALGPSPFSLEHLSLSAGRKGREPKPDVVDIGQRYLEHQLALARAHPLRISLTAFWGRSEVVEDDEEVDVSQRVFALLAGVCAERRPLDSAMHDSEDCTKQWEAFELVCPREDEWAVLSRVTAHRTFPSLRYLSLTFVGRSSGSTIPMPVSTPASVSRRRPAANAQRQPRERRIRDGRPGARHSVALPSGAFGGWRAGALPCLRGLLLRGVDLEGIVEDVLEHEYEMQDNSEHEMELDHLSADVFNADASTTFDPPEPALPALRTLDVRGHGLWADVDALGAFFTRHAPGLRRLGVHVRSGDVLRDVVGQNADGSSLVPASNSRLCIPNLSVLEVDTSEGLNRDTARMVRLLSGAAVSGPEERSGFSVLKRIVVKESGGVEGEELLRWSRAPRPRCRPCSSTTAKSEARLAITNSTIPTVFNALPPAILRLVSVLVLDVPAGEGGWGERRRLKEMLAIFGKERADSGGLGSLRRVEVRNADVLGIVREVLAQPRMSSSEFQFEHDEAGDEEDEDSWERFLSSAGMAEPLCAAKELAISFSETGSSEESQDSDKLSSATVAFVSLFTGSGWPEYHSCQSYSSPVMTCSSTSTSTHTSLERVILKGPTHSQVMSVLNSLNGGNSQHANFDGPQLQVLDIHL